MLYNHEKLIKTGFAAFGKEYALVYVPEGYEAAGAGMRHVNECFRVVYMFDGNRHSKAFKTQSEAQIEFDKWTKPIAEVKA